MKINYIDDMTGVTEERLGGFFVGWPAKPSRAQHLAVLRGSHRAIVAVDDDTGQVVGFVNMISDGVLTAFVPWLEVRPNTRGTGSAPNSSGASSPTPSASTPSICCATRLCSPITSASA